MTGLRRNRIAHAALLALGLPAIVSSRTHAQADGAAPKPTKQAGCVQRLPESDMLVISTPLACAKLTGKLSVTTLAGHEVELEGILTERTPAVPASIDVRSIVTVGKSCTETCSLQPPGTRGLGKGKQTPGKEGGTPGVVPTTPPPTR